MYTRDELIDILKSDKLQEIYDKYHISRVYLFGSYARNEQTEDSDVDLLVEYSEPLGFTQFFKLKEGLEGTLHVKKVDVINKEYINPILNKYIKDDTLLIQ